LNGIYYGAVLFMIASGLTVIFGILGILNFAHGELYAVGAYTGVTVIGTLFETFVTPSSNLLVIVGLFVVGALASALLLVPLGYVIEVTLLRRIYDRAEYYQLLLTFGILLVLSGIIKYVWGSSPVTNSAPYQAINSIPFPEALGWSYPTYNLLVIAIAAVTFLGMMWFFNNTKRGRIIRATAIDTQMSAAIGIDTKRTFTAVFLLGTFFAGFGGALAAPPIAATLGMGITPLVFAFVVIVIGGIGSVHGAFAASMLVGIASRWSIWLYPPAELAAPFVLMVIVLLVKRDGLFKSWGEFE
jgi:branched-chain amino acid transport system permease protein